MSILNILQYPDSRLHSKGHYVDDVFADGIQQIISDMIATLALTEHCAGLAATQLDIKNPPSIFVINLFDEKDSVCCFINPKIIESKEFKVKDEACMSIFPGEISGTVERAEKVKIEAINEHGERFEMVAEGILAQCLQHECDHLNGVLYIDRLSKLKRSRIEKKIAKLSAA